MTEKYVEILGGGDLRNGLYTNDVYALCSYQSDIDGMGVDYQVWELSKEDLDKLCAIPDEEWKDEWGWWRCADGSNCGEVNKIFTVNGKKMMGWTSAFEDAGDVFDDEDDAVDDDDEYTNILSYLSYCFGASQPGNVAAMTIDLARQNNMTLGDFFKCYLG